MSNNNINESNETRSRNQIDNRRNNESVNDDNRPRNNYRHHHHHHHHHYHNQRPNQRHNEQQQQQQQRHQRVSPKSSDDNVGRKADPMMTQRRKKLLSICSTNSHADSCICCLHDFNTFVYYQCMHFVCLNCAIKMRVLCNKKDCPVCRQESKTVLCTKRELQEANRATFDELVRLKSIKAPKTEAHNAQDQDTDVGIYFDTNESNANDLKRINDEYMDILANRCDLCPEDVRDAQFDTFKQLDSHVRKVHKRFYCELCLEHLKLFPYERKHYTREELALHKRNGDKNDYSFKGHPLCEYCDQRFFDRDELYRHFRKEHYYCHFCDTDGKEEYYKDYAQLRQHFLRYHYLCELDDCSQNAAVTHEYVVFRSELDFQAHKRQKHAKTKNDLKAYSRINIEFNNNNNNNNNNSNNNNTSSNNNYYASSSSGRHYNRNRRRNNDDQNEYDYDYERTRRGAHNQNQSKIQTTDVDANVLRQSKEQYEREEAERKRQTNIERLKEQFKEYSAQRDNEQTSQPATSSTLNTEPEESKSSSSTLVEEMNPVLQPVNTTWRNLLGSGAAPTINRDEEFPSLASLGAAISTSALSSSNKPSVWNKKSNNQTSSTSQNSSKKPAQPPVLPSPSSQKNTQLDQIATFKLDDSDSDSEFQLNKSNKKKNKKDKKNSTTSKVAEARLDAPPGFDSIRPDPKLNRPATPDGPPPGFSSSRQVKEFIKPENFDRRNSDLKSKLFDLFGHFNEIEFDNFKELSIEFRSSQLDATDYLIRTQKLLEPDGKKNRKITDNKRLDFLDLVQEMIALLPDQTKQQELYDAFVHLINKDSFLAKNIQNRLRKCEFCMQYFANSEFIFHQSSLHSKELSYLSSSKPLIKSINKNNDEISRIEEEFPSLGAASNQIANASTNSGHDSIAKLIGSTNAVDISPAQSKQNAKKSQQAVLNLDEEFPALAANALILAPEMRFSALPTPSIFSNPSSHLSILNKKKHRLQK